MCRVSDSSGNRGRMMNKRKLTGRRCQCGGCGEYFNSLGAFEKHRVGDHGKDRRCRSTDEMKSAGMALNPAGWWVGSVWECGFQAAREGKLARSEASDVPA
jgi:hypothetical protein